VLSAVVWSVTASGASVSLGLAIGMRGIVGGLWFAEEQPCWRQPRSQDFSLSIALCSPWWLGKKSRSLLVSVGNQSLHARQKCLVLIASFEHIGLKEDRAAWGQQTDHLANKRRGENCSLLLSLLPPGVWKVEEELRNAGVGMKAWKHVACVGGIHPCAVAVAESCEAIVDDLCPLVSNLESDDGDA